MLSIIIGTLGKGADLATHVLDFQHTLLEYTGSVLAGIISINAAYKCTMGAPFYGAFPNGVLRSNPLTFQLLVAK